ncbi:MAG: aminotransferase class I/II-fold pyridoxal phosphate-dependent enzyme, partial [Candidatus Hydrogenedentes bacterium]|nr:aminotransferase class I/II-fold pyridoxal phosphate-dependent enzyme [Candidatus Hydrogenedentota bacterium]
RVLVTGGAGYLGNHLVRLLLERGHAVRVFDRFCFGDAPAAALADMGCEIVRGDVRRLDGFPALLDGVEGVVHLAGLANDPSCDLDPLMALDVNFEATRELARRAIAAGVRRFVFASSCSVYGRGVFEKLDEECPTNPVSVYAQSKIESERTLLEWASGTFEPVIARPATLFGWSPRMRFDLAINLMVATASRHRAIKVYGGGNQWRPFVHVRDAARAFAAMLESPAAQVTGQVFNVGSDTSNYRIIDLAHVVAGLFDGVGVEVMKEDEDPRSYNVQFGKIARILGFAPEWSAERGAAEIRDWLAKDPVDPFSAVHFNVRRMKELLATPAAEGGEPVAPRFIPLSPPSIGDEEERAVIDVLKSGWLTTGEKVTEFERRFAERVGAPHAVAVSSCTAALHLCLVEAGVGPGDEVVSPPLTWVSTANTIANMGAKLVLADVLPDTLNLDPAAVERALTPRTKAIVPVHLAGQPCDLDAIHAVAKKHGVAVIEDAAHALGAAYNGVAVGGGAAPACFSFYPVKNITTIEGGMIALRDEGRAHALRLLAHNGLSTLAWNRYGGDAPPVAPEVVRPGFKYNMTNVSAAMGIEQLKKLDAFLAARRRIARIYTSVLSDVEEIELPRVIDGVDHAWHLYVVVLRLGLLKLSREEIARLLRQENVGTGVHFVALHKHRYYRETLGVRDADLPHASALSDAILSLPLHPRLTDKNGRDVVDALKKVLAHARR